MEKIFLSVIIPAYNVENYIKDALESLEKQTFKNFEAIIINDGSIDNTEKIAKEFCDKNKNFILISKANDGLSSARRTGVEKANGEYIYFLDSDDYIKENTFEFVYQKINADKLDAIMFNAQFINEMPNNTWAIANDKKRVVSKAIPDKIMTGFELLNYMIDNHEWRYAVWLYVVKKELVTPNKVGYFSKIVHEDAPYNFQMLNSVKRIKYFDESFYFYRIRTNSIMSSTTTSKNIESYVNAYRVIYNYININMKNLIKQCSKFEKRILDQIIEAYSKMDKAEKNKSYIFIKQLNAYLIKRKYYYNWYYFKKFMFYKWL